MSSRGDETWRMMVLCVGAGMGAVWLSRYIHDLKHRIAAIEGECAKSAKVRELAFEPGTVVTLNSVEYVVVDGPDKGGHGTICKASDALQEQKSDAGSMPRQLSVSDAGNSEMPRQYSNKTGPECFFLDEEASHDAAIDRYISDVGQHLRADVDEDCLNKLGDICKYLSFKLEYRMQYKARPDIDEGVLLQVTDWRLLTPTGYDRTCFHCEVDIADTSIANSCNGADGRALSVYATNDPAKVRDFIREMQLDPTEIVSAEGIAPPKEDGYVVLTTVAKLFTQYLDIFGKPTREFLKHLFPYARDIMEKVKIAELTLDRKADEFQERQARAYTFADYLTEFKSLSIPVSKYAELIPAIKQRVYSICSSSDYRPGKCQLLVVREDWKAEGGETKYGLCSSFLTFIRPGDYLVAHSTHSVMKLPEDTTVPIFMAGLGTGLAPFRAFVEQRKCQKEELGCQVGPMTLFFGGRYSKAEYYYRDEFEAFEKEGLVKCCNAWSRDTSKKVYVQHKIAEEADDIWMHLGREGSTGAFFLCGSKQPEKDVCAAILAIFRQKGCLSERQAQLRMDDLKAVGRYVTEVY